MKIKKSEAILLGSLLLVLVAPILPKFLLDITVGNRVGAFIVLCLVLYIFKTNMIVGLAAFLGSAALFLEYRRRTIDVIRMSFAGPPKQPGAPIKALSKPAKDLIPGETHPSSESPSIEDSGYEPSEESQTNEFEGSDSNAEFYETSAAENGKVPLETVPSNNSSYLEQMFLSKGLATLNSA